MTIRFVTAWDRYPKDAIITLPAPEEARLVALGFATSDLDLEQEYVQSIYAVTDKDGNVTAVKTKDGKDVAVGGGGGQSPTSAPLNLTFAQAQSDFSVANVDSVIYGDLTSSLVVGTQLGGVAGQTVIHRFKQSSTFANNSIDINGETLAGINSFGAKLAVGYFNDGDSWVRFTPANWYGGQALATLVVAAVSSPNVEEGLPLVYTVVLASAIANTETLTYAISGTASAGSDYTNTPVFSKGVTLLAGVLTVPAGVADFTITYPTVINGDANETLIVNVDGVIGTGTIYLAGTVPKGISLSPYPYTASVVSRLTVTETVTTNDGVSNGTVLLVPPATGAGVKTIQKNAGAQDSIIIAKAKVGYAAITGSSTTSPKYKIGNADTNLPTGHLIAALIRINKADLAAYTGEFEILKTSQVDGLGNPYFRLYVGGATAGLTSVRNNIAVARTGKLSGADGIVRELCGSTSVGVYYSTAYSTNSPAYEWMWVASYGRSASATAEDNWGLLTTSGQYYFANREYVAFKVHNSEQRNNAGLASRPGTVSGVNVTNLHYDTTQPNYVVGNDVANPGQLTNVDFIVGGSNNATSKTIHVARVLKLSGDIPPDKVAHIFTGAHPAAMGLIKATDFCVDFDDALPANVTLIQGANNFTPIDDGPILNKYFGLNAPQKTITITNQKVA